MILRPNMESNSIFIQMCLLPVFFCLAWCFIMRFHKKTKPDILIRASHLQTAFLCMCAHRQKFMLVFYASDDCIGAIQWR